MRTNSLDLGEDPFTLELRGQLRSFRALDFIACDGSRSRRDNNDCHDQKAGSHGFGLLTHKVAAERRSLQGGGLLLFPCTALSNLSIAASKTVSPGTPTHLKRITPL